MKSFRSGNGLFGFTLIELMIVVSIIGILAGTAIPLFSKYIRKSKTAEATLNIRKLYDGEISYFQEERSNESGKVVPKQFVTAGPTPVWNVIGINKQPGNWNTEDWYALKFAPDGPVQYAYQAYAEGTGNDSAFTCGASGDLDGDGLTSLFTRTCTVDSTGGLHGGGGIYSIDETE